MNGEFNEPLGLLGYSAIDLLYFGSKTLVYRAIRDVDQVPVVLKRLRDETPTLEEQARFRHQYTITKDLETPGIVRVIGLELSHAGDVLVMEDFGGVSLSEYLRTRKDLNQQNPRLSIVEFLSIALKLSITLCDLHRAKIIHKDIKPSNILIHPDSRQVRLIDFSIASQLVHQTQELQHPNQLEGTLAYLSPEQTGRMNRSLDYRSDFYSLGVTFYELLTGQLPFMGEDALEIVYCHLAKQPTPIRSLRSDVPEAIAAIVTQLMAKNAEDRYQSASGLQADLQRCLDEMKTTGTISEFEIGRLDRIAQFNIPEKLYGRETQVKILLDAFERARQGSNELVVVSGYSGVGKTSLIHELFKPVTESNAHFISGKFDQFKRDIPFACLAEAYRGFIRQILTESDAQIEYWRDRFQSAVGQAGQLIIDVIPELELLIGQQPSLPDLPPLEAQNRFNQTMIAYMLATSSPDYPVAVFMDDMQWIDSVSIASLQALMNNPENQYRLIVIAYRDNEVDVSHPLMQTLAQMQAEGVAVETIKLEPLSIQDVIQFVADSLCCDISAVQPLAKLLHDKTQGNPFFLSQLLKSLHAEELLTFDFEKNTWQWDIKQIHQQNITENVVELMIAKLQKLPSHAQTAIKLAACIGNQFELKTLSTVSQQSSAQTLQALWDAIEQGFIVPLDHHYRAFLDATENSASNVQNPKFKFLHDRVQQAAYELIAEDQKKATHLAIACLLKQNLSDAELEANIFEVVNHWNVAIELITEQSEKDSLAQLNLIAGRKAKASAAYVPAFNYFTTGLKLLSSQSWHTHYERTLALHEGAAEMAYVCSNFEQLDQCMTQVLQFARTTLDQVKLYRLKIEALTSQNNPVAAIQSSLEILQRLGIEFPSEVTQDQIHQAFQETAQVIGDRQPLELLNLPIMQSPERLAAMQIMIAVTPATYIAQPELFPLLSLKQVYLSVTDGNTIASAYAYAIYALLLCGNEEIDSGYEFGQLALCLIQQFQEQSLKAKTFFVTHTFVMQWKQHLRHNLQPLQQSYQIGLEVGDLACMGYSAAEYVAAAYYVGQPLFNLVVEVGGYIKALCNMNQQTTAIWSAIYHQSILNLVDNTEQPIQLIGQAYDETVQMPLHKATNDRLALVSLLINKMTLAYLFEEFQLSIDYATEAALYLDAATAKFSIVIYHFYASLSLLAVSAHCSEQEQIEFLKRVATNQEKMHCWAVHAPMNHQHKYDLVEAERCRVLGQNYEAMERYDRAITGATENGYIQEAALANELAARFYFSLNKPKVAQAYLIEARQNYQQWGAIAKVKQLEAKYPSYFLAPTISPMPTIQTRGSTSTSSEFLDFATVLKAAEAISSELVLERLLDRLLHIILENSGAQKGCIVLDREGELFIEVADTSQDASAVIVESIPLAKSRSVPLSVLQYVARTQKAIVSANATTESLCAIDSYVINDRPKSLLCAPIFYQGKFIGLVYLENNLVNGAFSSDRLDLVQILTGQAAIAIENAKLYAQVQQQNQDLQQALTQLQHNQAQMVQSEKMSALGNLVAGVAHEINNPIGFLNGSISNAKEFVQDLLDHLALYQQCHPNPATSVQNHAEDIDLEFLKEDLPKLLHSMKSATDRIKAISTSLRTFSRADTEHKIAANIHDGIDSTLLILKYRLKANEHRPAIDVVTNYGNIPPLECFPGQLNQVFMNILANAIDMFDEMAQQPAFSDVPTSPPTITLQTIQTEQNRVEIRIRDNGKGMSEAVKARIFDHLFTTKAVGKGTGLGLAIARQIIVEKHHGVLEVNSTVNQGSEFVILLPIVH